MGKNEISEKLVKQLKEPLKQECQIFGILVRIRKFIDHLDDEEKGTGKDKYSLLMFYCNWALHIKISKASSIRAVKTFLDGAENNDDKALAFFNFESLKEELKIFLIDFSLPKEIVENNMKWGDFTNLLREILLDTPIITPTDSIEKFSFKRSFRGILAKPNIYWSIEYTENDHDYKKPIIDL